MRKAAFTIAQATFGVLAASVLAVVMLAGSAAGGMSPATCTWCTLAFTTNGEPAGTAVNAMITSAFDSQGGPVRVEVLDRYGHLVTSSTAAVTIAIGSNPGSGSLSGATTVKANAGVATFKNLSINAVGNPYTLVATSPGIMAATSASFTIWGSLQRCSAASCSASAVSSTTMGVVAASSATGMILGTGLGGVSYTCAGTYRPVSDPFSFDLFDSSGLVQTGALFSGTLEIDKSTVQASGHPGASSWQICYASTVPFTALAGTSGTAMIGGVRYHTGLLPDCSRTQGAPCVQARHKDNAGDVVVAFLASGDIVMRG